MQKYNVISKNTLQIQEYNTITAITITFQSYWQWIPGGMVWIVWSTTSVVHQLCTTVWGFDLRYESITYVCMCTI